MARQYSRIRNAAGWSSSAEICARLIAPVSALLLARVLTPADFGAMTAVTLIISLADMVSECGLQKYLVQKRFKSTADLRRYAGTVMLTSIFLALLFWALIAAFSGTLARLTGCTGAAPMLALAGAALPLSAINGTQSALLRRWMLFKQLFRIRIAAACVPLIVTLPVAIIFSNWTALLFGMIATNLLNAVLASAASPFRPRMKISVNALRDMAPFSLWSTAEAILIWLTTYLDVLIVGMTLDAHHTGLYRTASLTVAQILGIVTASATPVLFSSLSRRQENREDFLKLLLRFQHRTALIIVPLCFGLFIFSDTVTSILLGCQWLEISGYIGLLALTAAPVTLISHFAAEAYRASGKPRLSMLSQLLHLAAVIPVVIYAASIDFETICTARALVRLEGVVVNLIMLQCFLHCRASAILLNLLPVFAAGTLMLSVTFLPTPSSLAASFTTAILSLLIYASALAIWPSQRKEILQTISNT